MIEKEELEEIDEVSWNEKNNPTRNRAVGERDPQKVGKSTSAYAINENKIEDKYKFEDVIKLLLENKNDKESSNVSIEIFYDEDSIELELPLSINYSEDLKSRLDLIIGNHNIIIT